MNITKHLVRDESEFLALFKGWELDDIETLLGVEFAFTDGTFYSDHHEDEDYEDSRQIDYSKYRKDEAANFPVSYPAIATLLQGTSLKAMMLVYPSDFVGVPAVRSLTLAELWDVVPSAPSTDMTK
jgi:hypothetical protein